MRHARTLLPALLGVVLSSGSASADAGGSRWSLVLLPEETSVAFRLGATLHTVEGALDLREGRVVFDEATGEAAGELVLDATSARTGIAARDEAMHARVLRSDAHPEVRFRSERVEVLERSDDRAEIRLHGSLRILGVDHEQTWPLRVERIAGRSGAVRARGEARIPYVAWGLEDVSTFLLRVDDSVVVSVDAVGELRARSELAEATP